MFFNLKLTTTQEVDVCQSAILLTEEVLLEALCFDFVVESPHAELLDLFESLGSDTDLQEYAWSLAHDSWAFSFYHLVHFSPELIPATELLCAFCTRLALLRLPVMFSDSVSLMDPILLPWMRVFLPVHLPTHFRLPLLINHHHLTPPELPSTTTISQMQNSPKFQVFHSGLKPQPSFLKRFCFAEAIGILLEFYSVQDQEIYPYLASIISVRFILLFKCHF